MLVTGRPGLDMEHKPVVKRFFFFLFVGSFSDLFRCSIMVMRYAPDIVPLYPPIIAKTTGDSKTMYPCVNIC